MGEKTPNSMSQQKLDSRRQQDTLALLGDARICVGIDLAMSRLKRAPCLITDKRYTFLPDYRKRPPGSLPSEAQAPPGPSRLQEAPSRVLV